MSNPRFRILGSLEVGDPPIDLGPPKQRTVLAVLLLHPNEVVPTERLIELVWGESPPRTAAHSVQIYVSDLRRILAGQGAEIITRPPGYLLQVEPETIDAAAFERQVDAGLAAFSEGQVGKGVELLRAAVDLWRGAALSEFVYEDFAQGHIRRLEERRNAALEELAELEVAAGRGRHVVGQLQELVAREPLRERPRRLLMLALHNAGRQAEALRAYSEFEKLLGEELGISPSPDLARVEEQILLQDPSLPGATKEAPPASESPIRNPYKGLRPFGEADADDFFGREELVAALVRRLEEGQRLLVVAGPSGCGKSSLVRGGAIPALKGNSSKWVVVQFMPGPRPFEELQAALVRTADDLRIEGGLDRSWLMRAALSVLGRDDQRLLLVVDQFEELFALASDEDRQLFLDNLVTVLTDPRRRVSVVLTLRADFYDRPLLHPGFAGLFVNSMVTMLPLSPSELESAVVGPARRVGVGVEPALLVELAAEMGDQPGALPLLQYALTETFELREGQVLTLDTYRRVGGLKGALSGRSEHVFQGLDTDEQETARHVLLRLVRPGPDTGHTRKRTAVAELLGLELDPVAVGRVIEEFTANRLLTVDRDPVTGAASVEVAHEALLREWPRLADAIDDYRQDLTRHEALEVAVAAWEEADRDADYLFSGSRLSQFNRWRNESGFRLGAAERQFLDASTVQQEAREAEDAVRRERETVLERQTRRRTWSLVAVVALFVAAATYIARGALASPAEVVLFWDGNDSSINRMLVAGFDQATEELDLDAEKIVPVDFVRDIEVTAAAGPGLLVTSYGGPPGMFEICPIAANYPDTHFAYIDGDGSCPGMRSFTFAHHEGSYLVGAAAALKSKTGIVGFVGGVNLGFIQEFGAGFAAGARRVNPDIEVLVDYLTAPPDFSGFQSPTQGSRLAEQMYRDGADVIYHAAGDSGWGVIGAAAAASVDLERHLWAIGVDSDQHEKLAELIGFDTAGWDQHILTSMVKRFDVAVRTALEEFDSGRFGPGEIELDLASEGVGYVTTGGFIDDIVPDLERIKAEVATGSVLVPRFLTDSNGLFSANFSPPVRMLVPEGWAVLGNEATWLGLADEEGTMRLELLADPVAIDAEEVGTSAQELAEWSASHPGLAANDLGPTTIGGVEAWSVDIAGTSSDPVSLYALRPPLDGFPFTLGPDEETRVMFLDLPNGHSMLISVWARSDSSLDGALEVLGPTLVSLTFE